MYHTVLPLMLTAGISSCRQKIFYFQFKRIINPRPASVAIAIKQKDPDMGIRLRVTTGVCCIFSPWRIFANGEMDQPKGIVRS